MWARQGKERRSDVWTRMGGCLKHEPAGRRLWKWMMQVREGVFVAGSQSKAVGAGKGRAGLDVLNASPGPVIDSCHKAERNIARGFDVRERSNSRAACANAAQGTTATSLQPQAAWRALPVRLVARAPSASLPKLTCPIRMHQLNEFAAASQNRTPRTRPAVRGVPDPCTPPARSGHPSAPPGFAKGRWRERPPCLRASPRRLPAPPPSPEGGGQGRGMVRLQMQ